MWPAAVASDEFGGGHALAARDYEQRMLRLFGIPESEIAETLRVAEPVVEGFEQLEITTCLRRGELEVVVRHEPATKAAYDALEGVIRERHGQYLYSTDGTTIDDQVSELLGDMQIAVGESCTGGLMAARLTSRPGSSGCVQGGVVAYSNEAKAASARRRPGADRAPRRGLAGGGGGAGRRGDRALRRRRGGGHHGDRGPGRRDRGEAGRLRVLVREARRRAQDGARRSPSGRPATRCATARRPWRCTCCAGSCAARSSRSDEGAPRLAARAALRGARPARRTCARGSRRGATSWSPGATTCVPSPSRRFTLRSRSSAIAPRRRRTR